MKDLLKQVKALFVAQFGVEPTAVFQAPGRVNLIGEHTDYNGGFVLPCAIDRQTLMAVRPRDDCSFRVVAGNFDNQVSQWQSALPIAPDETASWANYLRGVNEQFLKHHSLARGLDVVTLGNIPQGTGLSSSASFSVAFAEAIAHTNDLQLAATDIALLCQAAENEYFGCRCGIMDQLVSAAGQEGHALLIDCATLTFEPVAMPADLEVVIIDSKVSRGLVDSEYDARREQCESAARVIGVDNLAQATMDQLLDCQERLDPVVFRRARHVIKEHKRTQLAAQALSAGDYARLSRLMADSHASMRDDFEITTWQLDYLIEIVAGVLGARGGTRMTGGGFGGCVVALSPPELTTKLSEAVARLYPSKTDLMPEIHICRASPGAGILE